MKKTLHLLANKLIYLLILLLGLSINSFGAVSYIQSGAHLFLDEELEKFNYSGTNFTLELSQEVKESIKKAKNNGYYVEFSSWHGDNTNNWDYKSGYEHLTTELVNTNGEYTGLKIKNSGYNPTHYIIIAVRIYNNAQISNSTYCTVIKSIIKPADHFLADNFKIQGNSSNKGFVCNYGGDGKETYNAVKSWNSRFGTFNSVTYKWTLSGNIKATSGTTGTAGSTYTSVTIDGNKGSGNGTLKLSVSFSYKIGSTTYSTTKDYSVAVTVKDVNGFKSSNQWPGDHYTWGGNLWTGSKLGDNDTLALTVPAPSNSSGIVTYTWQSSTNEDKSGYSNCGASTKDYSISKTTYSTHYRRIDQENYCYNSSGKKPQDYAKFNSSNSPQFTVYIPLTASVSGSKASGALGSTLTTLNYGEKAVLSCSTSGSFKNSSKTYSWQSKTSSGSWTSCGSGSSITVTATTTETEYRCVVSDSYNTNIVSSNTVKVKCYSTALSSGSISNSGSVKNTVGTSVTLTASPSGGSGSYTYQWYAGGTSDSYKISGATSKSYTVSYSTETSKTFYCKVTSNGATATTSGYTVYWYSAVTAGSISGSSSLASGKTATLTVTGFNGDGGSGNASNYTFQWYADGAVISGATSTSITVGGSGYTNKSVVYKCLVKGKNTGSSAYTDNVTVSWDSDILVTISNSGSDKNTIGTSITLTANTSGGSGSYTYQWYADGTSDSYKISGANSKSYTVSYSTETSKTFYCKTTNNGATSTSSGHTVNWYSDVTAGTVSGSGTLASGETTTLTVTGFNGDGGNGNANNYIFQWYADGAAISGATTSSLTVGGNGYANKTVKYKCLVKGKNIGSSAYTSEVTVTWNTALAVGDISITSGNAANNINGASVILAVSPNGGAGANSYTYKWHRSTTKDFTPSNSTLIANSNSATITTTSSGTNAQTYYYKCVVTSADNTSHEVTSNQTSVSWLGVLSVIASCDKDGMTVPNGSSVSLNCTATGGNGSHSYQWQYKYAGIDWTNLSTTQNTSVQNTNPYTYQYRVIATSNGESITSDIIIITWAPELHASISCTEGSGTTFNLAANQSTTLTCSAEGGNGSYSYQWYYNDGSEQILSGKTSNTLTIGTDKAGFHGEYLCKVTSIDETISTNSIDLWWNFPKLNVTIHQVDDTWEPGTERPYSKPATMEVLSETGGDPSHIIYKWQISSDNIKYTDIKRGNTSQASIDKSQAGSESVRWIRLMITTNEYTSNGYSEYDTYSNTIKVTWQPAISATISSTKPYPNESATLTCSAKGGSGSYTYQWYANGTSESNKIDGATSSTYTTEAFTDKTIKYYCSVTSNGSTVTSNECYVIWHKGMYAFIIGGDTTATSGDYVTLTAIASAGENIKYLWYEDDIELNETSDNTIAISLTTSTMDTHSYKVKVSADDAEEPFTSEEVTITWLPELIPGEASNNGPQTMTPSEEEIEIGGSEAQGGIGIFTYRWEKCDETDNEEFVVIEGATTPTINVSPTLNTKYRRYDISGTQEKLAFELNVVLPLLPGKLLTNDTTICFGSKFADLINAEDPIGGGKCSYQWKYFTDSTFGELINVDSVASDGKYLQGYELTQTTWFVRYCYYTNIPEVAGYSDTVKVTVLPQLTLSMPVDQNLCSSDQLGTLKVEAQGGTGNYSYKWFANYVDFDNVVLSTTDSLIDSHFGSSTKTEGTTIYTVEVYDKCTDVMSGYATGNFSVTQRKSLAKGNSSFDESTIINQATINIGDTGTSTLYSNTLYNISDYYTYSWYYKTEGNDAWLQINHADSNKYIVDHSAYTMNTYFKYSITDNICEDTIYGDSLLLTVINSAIPDKPTLNNGTGMSICYNTVPSSISINNIGSETYTAYSWFAKAIDENSYSQLENESGNTLTFDSNQALKVSTYFKARLYMSNGKYVDTDPILITVLGEILPGEIGIGQNHLEVETIKHGTTPSMILSEIDAECDSAFQYQWYKKTEGQMDFETIAGATGKDYQPESLTETTMFYRSAISYCTEVYSNIVKFVIEESELTIVNLKKRYCYGEDVSITVEDTTGTTYKWTASDGNLLSSGKDLKINRLTQNTTIVLSSYDKDMNKTGEKTIDLTIVKLKPAFTCSKLSIEAGDVVHFGNESDEFATCVWDFGDGSDGSNMPDPWHYYNEQGTFDVTLTIISEEGCTETLKQSKLITAEGWLGGGVDIDGEIATNYKVYPNPVKDKLTVEMQQSGKVTLYDETNKVLFVSNEDEIVEIDMTPYPQGIYILSVENDGNINRTKVVKY